MSFFPGYQDFYMGGGYGLQVAQLDSKPTPAADKPVEPNDPVDRSNQFLFYSGQSAYPGFDIAPPPSIHLYWEMRGYSAIVLAYAVTTGPILAGTRTVEVMDDGWNSPTEAEEWKKLAEKDLLPVLEQGMEGMCECLHFGNWLQESIWGYRDNRTVPLELRSFLPGQAVLHKDKYGQFTGFEINGEFRDARYAFLSVNQPHIDPIFGYARNRNCRLDWWRIQQSDLNGDRIERKAAGIQMTVSVPIGASWTNDKGEPLYPRDVVQSLVNSAAKGETFLLPRTPFTKKDIISKPELADIDPIKIQAFDWGNTAPAILAQIARADAKDKRIMRAWCRPEREAMEGQHGTKAESGVQGQIGVTDSELIHARRCHQFNRQIVDRWLVANRGPGSEGMLFVKPTPLSDPQQQFLQAASLAILADTTNAEARAQVAPRELFHRVEMPMKSEEDADKALAEAEAQKQEAAQQKMEQMKAAQPPANGNGRTNGDAKLAASVGRIAGWLGSDGDDE